jgi:hypothetical protein
MPTPTSSRPPSQSRTFATFCKTSLPRLSASGFRFSLISSLLRAVHLPCLFGAFVYDDVKLIPEHQLIASEGFATQIWSRDYGLEFRDTPLGFYRPLFMSIVWLIHTLAGPNAIAFHLFSLGIFCLATYLVTRLALTITPRSPLLAIAVGTLYALHPARVETVSLVMSLPDLIVEICALGLLLQMVGSKPLAPWRALGSGVILATIAGLSKESTFFIFPALALTAIAHALLRKRFRTSALSWLGVGALLGLLPALLLRAHAGIQAPTSFPTMLVAMWGERARPVLGTLAHACKEIILPGPVVFWRLLPSAPVSVAATLALALLFILCALLWLGALRNKEPILPLLAAWLGANLVTLSMLGANSYAYSQRYLTVAPALLLLGIGGRLLARRLASPHLKQAALLALVLYLSLHGFFTFTGSLTCQSQTRFFIAMRDANPTDVIPWGAVAESFNREQRPAHEVEACIRKATELDPTHPQISPLHDMLIKRHLDDQSFGEALRIVDEACQRFPADSDKMVLRSVALASLGRFEEALAQIDAAIAAAPDNSAYQTLRKQITANAP